MPTKSNEVEDLAGEWVRERQLCDASDINRHSLRRARKWLFLEFKRPGRGRGSGSETLYRPAAIPLTRRFEGLGKTIKNPDARVWIMWLEGHPFDILKWADKRISLFEERLSSMSAEALEAAARGLSEVVPKRTEVRNTLFGRLTSARDRSLLIWSLVVAYGSNPLKSLYDPKSAAFDALKAAGGLKGNWQPPDPELAIENFSLAFMRTVLRDVAPQEREQARHDFASIARLAEISDTIDWHAVRKAWAVQVTSSAQPPAPADFMRSLWRNFDARAIFLAGLIHLRRSPEHSQKLTEILTMADWVLGQLPRRTPKAPWSRTMDSQSYER